MDLRELQYLLALAEEKSISRAAERLFMAQSSLSQFLSQTEAQLGYKLFIRTSSGIRPTEPGKRMIRFAYETLAEFHRAKDEIQDIGNLKGGHVILGISSFRGSFLLPPVLHTFQQQYPAIRVQIVEENSLALEQLLISGKIDLALLAMPEKRSRIQAKFLMEDEICLITSPNHPVMECVHQGQAGVHPSQLSQYIDIEDAACYEFLLSGYDTILGREARRIFLRHGMNPTYYNENLSALFAASLGASGLGLAFTYASSRQYFHRAQLLSLGKDGTSIALGTAMAPGRYHSKATKALERVIFEVLGER